MVNKSCELDFSPTKPLKDIVPGVIGIVTKLINKSLQTEVFLAQWKVAIIHPLLKKSGLPLITNNCRPVNNLTVILQ